ncbi:MAG TPA: hypothetical protein PK103_08655, partial [Elusimicrobiales bacterium]|nr:hypothetical protein [Elusimicrobiales bacterium]
IIAIDSSNYSNNFQLPVGIWNQLASTRNYISFRVFDNADNVYISTDTFYVLKDTTPPNAPMLLSPSDNSQSSVYNINFIWSGSSDDVSGISFYDLYVSTDENFSIIYSSKTSSLTNVSISVTGGRYYWKVRAKDMGGNYSTWSSTFSVFIDTIQPHITNNQSGDNIWRKENNGFYDV